MAGDRFKRGQAKIDASVECSEFDAESLRSIGPCLAVVSLSLFPFAAHSLLGILRRKEKLKDPRFPTMPTGFRETRSGSASLPSGAAPILSMRP